MLKVKINSNKLQNELSAKANKKIPNAVKTALNESASLVEKYAKEKHKFESRTGKLVSAIKSDVTDKAAKVFVDEKEAEYARPVIEGFKPFEIHGNPLLVWQSKADTIFARRVHHPGKKPDDFLNEAFEKNREKINKIFQNKLKEGAGLK